jgi:hypothetical protein
MKPEGRSKTIGAPSWFMLKPLVGPAHDDAEARHPAMSQRLRFISMMVKTAGGARCPTRAARRQGDLPPAETLSPQ